MYAEGLGSGLTIFLKSQQHDCQFSAPQVYKKQSKIQIWICNLKLEHNFIGHDSIFYLFNRIFYLKMTLLHAPLFVDCIGMIYNMSWAQGKYLGHKHYHKGLKIISQAKRLQNTHVNSKSAYLLKIT